MASRTISDLGWGLSSVPTRKVFNAAELHRSAAFTTAILRNPPPPASIPAFVFVTLPVLPFVTILPQRFTLPISDRAPAYHHYDSAEDNAFARRTATDHHPHADDADASTVSDDTWEPRGGYPDPTLSPRSEKQRYHAHIARRRWQLRLSANRAVPAPIHPPPRSRSARRTSTTLLQQRIASLPDEGIFNSSGVLEPCLASIPDEGILNSSGVLEPFVVPTPTVAASPVYLDDTVRSIIYSYFYLPPLPTDGGWGAQPAIREYERKFPSRQHHLSWPRPPSDPS